MKNIDTRFFKLDLHDLPAIKMELLFEAKQCLFVLNEWDDKKNEYKNLIIIFEDIDEFETNDISNEKFVVNSLFDADIQQKSDGRYRAELQFKMKFISPLWSLKFTFTKLKLQI